jgi:uncharacterized membrane protein
MTELTGPSGLPESLDAVVVVAALGCALVGGVFFAFSGFVMQALARLPAADGMAAMKSVNVTAVRPTLMLLMFGTAAVCVLAAVWASVADVSTGARLLVVGGAAAYVAGCVGVTAAANVPRNNRLDQAEADSAEGLAYWADYQRSWTRWNTVRTVACTAAAVLLSIAAVTGSA